MGNLSEVINFCKKYSHIVVTGPQRSGTTIASKILAYDLGYKQFREEDIRNHSLRLLYGILRKKIKAVIQAPGLASVCHFLDSPGLGVVFMRRNPKDILSSQERIMWRFNDVNLNYYFCDKGEIARVRYKAWENHQKKVMKAKWIELSYSAMEGHPLWVRSEDRKGFGPRQTNL